jgi:hypothetical protein
VLRSAVAYGAGAFAIGCAVTALDVGGDSPSVEPSDAAAAQDASMDAPVTLLERLSARCAEPSGAPDYFASAAELTQRLRGRWYFCPALGNWAKPPQAIEFTFTSSGVWAFASLDDAGADFVASTDPDETGGVLYLVPMAAPSDASAEGGDGAAADAGTTEVPVPIDDTSPLNGFELQLVRGDANDSFFIPEFELSPRRMRLRELGGDPALGVFVPID